jgi:deoxyribose-phosphate aldolase
MEKQELWQYVDHTILSPLTVWPQVEKLCEEAVKYKAASVCVPPGFVKRIAEIHGSSLVICTVIGFPLGYNTSFCKVEEAKEAIANGAAEIDMVINQGFVKEGNFKGLEKEIVDLRKVSEGKILKVIVETCNLNEDEKRELCRRVTGSGADFIKTSTGFDKAGARLEDIKLFAANVGKNVKIKASGGISTLEDMIAFIDAGASRLGMSRAVQILC